MNDPITEPISGGHSQILTILLYQHHLLRKHLVNIREKMVTSSPDFSGIIAELKNFQDVLTVHLNLEDGEFYPQIIRHLEEKRADTKSVREFIAKMKEIGREVYGFLDRYDTALKIEHDLAQFKKDFMHIEGVLLLRISTEEESVYLYWEL